MGTATAFGLDVWAERPLSFLQPTAAAPTGRELRLAVAEDGAGDLAWPAGAKLISDQRQADGEVLFQIEAADRDGYRIWGPLYGASVIAADGASLRGAPGEGGMPSWQRLLVAQVLPFTAVLQGLDVLHASGVVIDGGAFAFIGPSGAGKTSVAMVLARRGAGFLADDVIAVERRDGELVCHPGAPVAGIDRAEAERLSAQGTLDDDDELDRNPRERMVRMSLSPQPAPLRGMFLLDRREDGPAEPRFEPLLNPQVLLSSTFNLVLSSPDRLEGLLDACALAARQRVERVIAGPSTGAEQLALAIERRIEGGP